MRDGAFTRRGWIDLKGSNLCPGCRSLVRRRKVAESVF
jgi:hypothetical protein